MSHSKKMVTTNMAPSPGKKLLPMGIFLTLLTCFLLDFRFYFLVDSLPPSTTLPISFNSPKSLCNADPYCEINVKGLLMDPPNVYIHHPLAKLCNYYLDIANSYKFISANAISLFHVIIAILAGKLVSNDALYYRRMGVILFEIRNYLDALDGAVAIASRQSSIAEFHNSSVIYNQSPGVSNDIKGIRNAEFQKQMQDSADLGYYLDGICDGLGCTFLLIGCFFYLQKHPMRKSMFSYNPLPLVIVSSNSDSSEFFTSPNENDKELGTRSSKSRISDRYNGFRFRSRKYIVKQLITSIQRSGLMAVSFGAQTLLGSFGWNRCITNYSRILEYHTPPGPSSLSESQIKSKKANLLHSPSLWFVFLMWRYVNPHALIEILLVAIFFDRMGDLLSFFRFFGFVLIAFAACVSETYMYSIEINM